MNSLEELENSPNIQDRKEYVRRMKLHLAKWEAQLPEIKDLDDGTTTILNYEKNKQVIKNLKTKLQNYGIYNQKFKCRTCQEIECVCYELSRSNPSVPKELPQESPGGQSPGSSDLETLRGTTGNNSDSSRSEEDMKLPF